MPRPFHHSLIHAALVLAAAALPVASLQAATRAAADAAAATPPAASHSRATSPVVKITHGKVRGILTDGVQVFRGIPYARAERFMPPTAPTAWSGIRKATRFGNICPQAGVSPFPGGMPMPAQSEDCLNLNVWTPAVDNGRRAVMVWLHGGGFSNGSSMESVSYDGASLSRTGDVVVVSVNHRLNVLGHLNLSALGEKYADSANVGVMDLVASLRWVQENIARFGGDPGNVTIFGESGGGAKVLTLMSTPQARGLFHKAIEQSGAIEKMGMTLMSPDIGREVAARTLANLGIPADNPGALHDLPYEQLNEAADRALKQVADTHQLRAVLDRGIGLAWAPTTDGQYIPAEPVGEAFPDQAKDIPLLIGSNLNEWESVPLLLNRDKARNDNRKQWSTTQVEQKLKEKYGDRAEAIATAFQKAYPDKTRADALYVDHLLRTPALKTAALKADQDGAPVYAYVFSWETPALGGVGMAYHTAEIPFIFNNIDKAAELTGTSPQARRLARVMSGAWLRFAKTGNPNGDGMIEWKPFTRANGDTMIFNDTLRTVQHHDRELMQLLTSKGRKSP